MQSKLSANYIIFLHAGTIAIAWVLYYHRPTLKRLICYINTFNSRYQNVDVWLLSNYRSTLPNNLHLSYTIRNICIQIISKTINGLILCLLHLYPSCLRINITCGSINLSASLIPDVLILCLLHLYPSRLCINITCGSINLSSSLNPDVGTNGIGQKSNTDMLSLFRASKVVERP